MKIFLGYLAGFATAFLIIGIVGSILQGVIPMILSVMGGAWLGNKVFAKIVGRPPKEFTFFGIGKNPAKAEQTP